MVDLQKPSFETRLAILRSKARIHALRLPDHALEVIAERCCPTVRELEGYLNRVLAYVPLVGGQVTPEIIEKALTPLSPPQPAPEDVTRRARRHHRCRLPPHRRHAPRTSVAAAAPATSPTPATSPCTS